MFLTGPRAKTTNKIVYKTIAKILIHTAFIDTSIFPIVTVLESWVKL